MLQKSSAQKAFCAEDWRFYWEGGYIKQAGSIEYQSISACGVF